MATQSHLPSALLKSSRAYAGQLTSLIKAKAPTHLQKGVKPTTAVEIEPGVIRITATVVGKDARAQEYGSGLHKDGRMGKKEKYPISPKNKKLLAFYENARGTWMYPPEGRAPTKFAPDGRGLFGKVMHPGIKKYKGRGYVRPAVREWTKNIKNSDISKAVKEALLGDIRKSFQTGWKK